MIAFGRRIEAAFALSDAEFFSQVDWDDTAPKSFVRCAQSGSFERLIERLARLAAGRVTVESGRAAHSSLWSRAHLDGTAAPGALVRAWEGSVGLAGRRGSGGVATAALLSEWADSRAAGAPTALETLVLFEILRDAGLRLSVPLFARLWRAGLTAAIRRAQSDGAPGAGDREPEPAIIDAEILWQAGLLFSSVAGFGQILENARERLRLELVDSTDAAGIPSAATIESLPVRIVSLVRAREWGHRFDRRLFDAPHGRRFRSLLIALAPLCRGDGSPALTNGSARGLGPVWQAAVSEGRLRRRSAAFGYLALIGAGARPRRASRTTGRPSHPSPGAAGRNGKSSPRPGFQSDASRLACLRTDWTPQASALTVSHSDRFPLLELAARGRQLLAGAWEIDLAIDGVPIAFDAPWTCACWHSDAEGDYIELQIELDGGVRVERQLLLPRKDDFLFLADVVMGAPDQSIAYASRLPLAGGVTPTGGRGTREIRLTSAGGPARAIPLFLPCDPVWNSTGGWSAGEGTLDLRQRATSGLYTPVVIDWKSGRRRSPTAWRALTVAQNGSALPASAAGGFRLQIGREQWLVYRSLSPILEPRTVLGHHTLYETVIGRFQGGDVDPIVLVEQSAARKR